MNKNKGKILNIILPVSAVFIILVLWQAACGLNLISPYLLPSPTDIISAFVTDRQLLFTNSLVTLSEAVLGLFCGILTGFFLAVLMDRFEFLYKSLYPLIVVTQTIPTVAIAPLLVLWFGYGMLPKVVLIIIATFFPIAVSLLEGFRDVDRDQIRLLKSMGANSLQIFSFAKIPSSLGPFFASLKISASYSIVGAVISEWLGGFWGLGVYMTRVKKSFSFDKMFAVIFLITAISLILMGAISLIQKKCMPWEKYNKDKK